MIRYIAALMLFSWATNVSAETATVGVFDVREAFMKAQPLRTMDYGMDIDTQAMRDQLKRLSAEYGSVESAFEKEFFRLSEEERKIRELQVKLQQTEIRKKMGKIREDHIKEREKIFAAVLEKLDPILSEYAEKNGILMIIEPNSSIYLGEGVQQVDITQDIVDIVKKPAAF